MKKIYIGLLFGLMTLSSCNKYLDIKPKGFTIPENLNDYKLLLNDQGLISASPVYPNYLTDNLQSGDPQDVQSAASFDYYDYVKKQLYSLAHGAIFEDGQYDPYWETAYSHIFTYNVIINNVLVATDGSETEKKRVWAEAKIGRAFEYLSLVNIYAAHYNPANAAKDLGVPLVLKEDINQKYERVSVQAIYDLVLNDLNDALPHLSTAQSNKSQAVRSVGYSFLSRVYLYQGKFKEALENAKQALALNKNLINYNLYTNKDKTTFGRVCLKTDNSSQFPDARTNIESIWTRSGTSSLGSQNAEFYASKELIDTYAKDLPVGANDKRYELFFCRDQASFGPNLIKFPGRVLYAPYVDFSTGFNTPELFLIAAEAAARTGNTGEALEFLNTLRNSRIENNKALTAGDPKTALQLALDERRREMPFMASTRLIDLKRLVIADNYKKSIKHPLASKVFEMESTDLRMILPVPPKVLSLNPGIPQYER
ncbi:RagB/SusD family nutrient uptake outer membrane protein [Sphingobacterium detergens]|uniref:SusD-like starch-binding protein associating with outer membrane n=1 Tax=Sphingobacterium detergens TaxID=1145106 RepID=A0A420AQZ8_SPHD1|nr:RagB/SusD family nutrient uptake outer membrane protein [Sphingobacterium detergens]RKE46889.1 SusD-like starch-binding protein associating with outer membrane [Sphingobacterium detergens]